MDIQGIIAIIAGVIAILGGFWGILERIQKKTKDTIRTEIKTALLDNNALIMEQTSCKIDTSYKLQDKDIKSLDKLVREHIAATAARDSKHDDMIKALSSGLIEKFKQDIREIYYILRNTGEISDADKAYIDKIFPYYVALGGNSDIHAKYKEICEVYQKRTQENYDKVYAKQHKVAGQE